MADRDNPTLMTLGPYRARVADAYQQPDFLESLASLASVLSGPDARLVASAGDEVFRWRTLINGAPRTLAVKRYKRQPRLKDWYDARRGSPAQRSFQAAGHLLAHQVGTPEPVAVVERWDGGRLLESYYLSLFCEADSLRECLTDVYRNNPDNEAMIELLNLVAPAVRAMHDAGFMHGDMGNQNILLPRDPDGRWDQPQFIDLNRGRILEKVGPRERARDIARLTLPGEYRKFFKFIYSHHDDVDPELNRAEAQERARFVRHRNSRHWRHPLRSLKTLFRGKPLNPPGDYPHDRDLWIWDEKSAQAMIVLSRAEKNRCRSRRYMWSMLWHSLRAIPGVYRHYRRLQAQNFKQPVGMRNGVGVALHPKADYIEPELAMLEELGNPPALVRFCHHETPEDWARGVELIDTLAARGVSIMVAFLQDRRAVLEPEAWRAFLQQIIPRIADKVEDIEIGHAVNRMKWGVWTDREYGALLRPALELQHQYPQIRLTGPACIDFEYNYVLPMLNQVPRQQPLSALSHHLYVDRRGYPENPQGAFSTLEKCVLLRAIAQWSTRSEDRVIISEVNWPVVGTSVWSPVCAGYEGPDARRHPPGVSEAEYANYLVRYQAIALCSGHVERVFWWRLSAHGYGLVDDRDSWRKRAPYRALKVFLDTLGEAEFVGRHSAPAGVYELEFQTAEARILLAWRHDGEGEQDESAYWPEFEADEVFDLLGEPVTDKCLGAEPRYWRRAR